MPNDRQTYERLNARRIKAQIRTEMAPGGRTSGRAVRESANGGLLPLQGVAATLHVNRRELYRLRQSEDFPRPVEMGYSRVVVWRAQDIADWAKKHPRHPIKRTRVVPQ